MQPKPTYILLAGDRETAVKTLYERYGKKLVAFAIGRWQVDEDAAWELAYKTLFRIAETYSAYRFASEEKFAAFVFTTFINYLRNHYRDNRKVANVTVSLEEARLPAAPETEEATVAPQMQLLQQALDGLKDWERMLLLLRSQEVPYAEIARLTGKPEDQLKVYYMRLKKKLATQLNEQLTALHNEKHGTTR